MRQSVISVSSVTMPLPRTRPLRAVSLWLHAVPFGIERGDPAVTLADLGSGEFFDRRLEGVAIGRCQSEAHGPVP